jgi:hypothetical protein
MRQHHTTPPTWTIVRPARLVGPVVGAYEKTLQEILAARRSALAGHAQRHKQLEIATHHTCQLPAAVDA